MENNETRTLWISIGAAGFAVMLLYGWAQGQRSDYARKFGQTKTVVIAKEDIQELEMIEETKLELVQRPSEFVEPNAIDNPQVAVGKMPLAPIKKGEQILDTKFVSPGVSTGLSMQVSPRKRAITIPVDEVRGVSKLIRPGDRIDIAAGADVGQGVNKLKKIKMILQDIPVLAVGKYIVDTVPVSFKGDDETGLEIHNLRVQNDYQTITVEVKPAEALNIMHILATGNPLYTLLRNPNDRYISSLPSADINSVLGRSRRKKKAAPSVAPVIPQKKAAAKKAAPKKAPAAAPRKRDSRFEAL